MPEPAEAVVVACPACKARLKMSATVVGKAVRCPKCTHQWTAAAESGAGGSKTGFPPPGPGASSSAAGLNPPSSDGGAAAVPGGVGSQGTAGLSGARLPAGTRVAEFEIVKMLGRGGMGTVYEAMDHHLERSIALKVLSSDLIAAGQEHVDRFLREAKTAAKLEHANAVNVYQVGRQGEIVYIAMQLVRGGSAADLIRAIGAVPIGEAIRVTYEAAQGLAAAHRIGLIHRDIKPANIMIGDNGAVKVADFGLAKAAASSGVTLSASGSVVGTPQYMCPEQCQGRQMDHRGDIYSLGVTFYCLLAGQPPFGGDNAPSILYKHCYEPLPDIRTLRPDVPEAVVDVLARAMAKKPADRYATTEEFIADLAALIDPGATGILTPSGRGGTTRTLPRMRTIGATAPFGAGAAAGGSSMRGPILWLCAVAVLGFVGVLVIRGMGGGDPETPEKDGKDKAALVTPPTTDKDKEKEKDKTEKKSGDGPPIGIDEKKGRRPETAAEYDALIDQLDAVVNRINSEPTIKAKVFLAKTLRETFRDNAFVTETMRNAKRQPDQTGLEWMRTEMLRQREEKFGPRSNKIPPKMLGEYHWEPFAKLPRGRDSAGESMYFLFDGAGVHGLAEPAAIKGGPKPFEVVNAGKADARLTLRADPLQKSTSVLISPGGKPFADFEFRCRFLQAGPEASLGLGYRQKGVLGSNTGPLIALTPQAVRLMRMVDGRPGGFKSGAADIAPGAWHELRLTVYGRTHRVTVDGKQIMNEVLFEDAEPGWAGLVIRGEVSLQEVRIVVFDGLSRP